MVHQLSRSDARRIAVRAQLLDAERPAQLLDVVRHLTVVQADQTAAVAPNADLVLWSRLGSAYSSDDLATELEKQRLIDYRGMFRPAEDIALYRAEMEEWPGAGELPGWRRANAMWIEANDACRRDILERLACDGPLPAREIPDSCVAPWRSTGWNDNRNVVRMLELMVQRGEVAVAGRDARGRLWDLAERVYPEVDAVPAAEARRIRNERRLHALGIARSRAAECGVEPLDVDDAGEPAIVEGVKGEWRVDPAYLAQPFTGRVALLSPLDRLVFDRKRMLELFEFDYQLEMYKPVAKRRWGYFALPILYGDRLVGKLDAAADREAGVLRVHALHRDVEFSARMTAAVRREIEELARWLRLDLGHPK